MSSEMRLIFINNPLPAFIQKVEQLEGVIEVIPQPSEVVQGKKYVMFVVRFDRQLNETHKKWVKTLAKANTGFDCELVGVYDDAP